MSACFICLVPRGKDLHRFRTPKDPQLFAEWEKAIGRKGLKSTSSLCHNHFAEKDIIKYHELLINGNIVREPRFKWNLRKGTVPSLQLESIQRRPYNRRKPIEKFSYESLKTDAKNMNLPDGFTILNLGRSEENSFCISSFYRRAENGFWSPVKQIIVSEDLKIKIYVREQRVYPSHLLQCVPKNAYKNRISSIKQLENILEILNEAILCSGAATTFQFPFVTALNNGFVTEGNWFSTKCQITLNSKNELTSSSQNSTCANCKKLLDRLFETTRRLNQNIIDDESTSDSTTTDESDTDEDEEELIVPSLEKKFKSDNNLKVKNKLNTEQGVHEAELLDFVSENS